MFEINQMIKDASDAMSKGRYDIAIKRYNMVLEYDKYNAHALNNLAVIYINTARLDAAEKAIMTLLEDVRSVADEASAFNHLAVVYIRSGRILQASKLLEHALSLDPFKIETFYNMANAYSLLGDIEKALHYCLEAVKIDHTSSAAYNNLGTVLNSMARFEEAKIAFETSIELDKKNQEPMVNLASLYARVNDTDNAILSYEKVLKNLPPKAKTQQGVIKFLLSFEYFKKGNFIKGYNYYDYGFHPNIPSNSARAPARRFKVPLWDGRSLKDKVLLVWREQGVGDEILFLSLIPDFIKMHRNIILEVDSRLVDPISRSFPEIKVRAQKFGMPPHYDAVYHDYDFHIPIGSLMQYVRPNLESYANSKPFIHVGASRKADFAERLQPYKDKVKIGICWRSGNVDPLRNLHYLNLNKFGALFEVENFQIVNLQYGDCEGELVAAESYFGKSILRWPDLNLKDDFDGTFALMTELDFIVTVGTSVHEMGGAVGTKTLFITPPGGWHSFGQARHVWFPDMTIFESEGENMEGLIPKVAQYILNQSSPAK